MYLPIYSYLKLISLINKYKLDEKSYLVPHILVKTMSSNLLSLLFLTSIGSRDRCFNKKLLDYLN